MNRVSAYRVFGNSKPTTSSFRGLLPMDPKEQKALDEIRRRRKLKEEQKKREGI